MALHYRTSVIVLIFKSCLGRSETGCNTKEHNLPTYLTHSKSEKTLMYNVAKVISAMVDTAG